MSKIKPNSIEAVMFFALYICAQDKKIAESEKTELVSEFGSTACKAFYKCTECLEPFDFFKCI